MSDKEVEIVVIVPQELFDASCEYCSNRLETAVLETNGNMRLTVKNHFECLRCNQ